MSSQNLFFSRVMDSLAVLLAVAALTFFLIRLNVTIETIKWFPLLFAGLSLLFAFRFQLFALCLGSLLAIFGLGMSLWQLQPGAFSLPAFQALGLAGQLIVGLGLGALVLLYLLRSFCTSEKVLLKFLAFSFLAGASFQLASSLPVPALQLAKPLVIKTGDPLASLKLNPVISEEALAREEKRLGLDKAPWQQFVLWLDGIVCQGDFGYTQEGQKVLESIESPLRNTIILNLIVVLVTWLLSLPLGALAALKKGTWIDALILNLSSVSLSLPAYLLAILVLGFAARLGLAEIGGLTSASFDNLDFWGQLGDLALHLFVPVAILTFVSIGGLIRQMRANMLDVLGEDYIKAARARGLSEFRILWSHAIQNAINPLITLLGFEFAALLSGAAITEMVLAYPGIGSLTLEAVLRQDVNLILFNLLTGTGMLMLGNVLSDGLLWLSDPRLRVVVATGE